MLKESQRIVVTGGAGFIGSHLLDSLLDEGHSVLCLDNFNDSYTPQVKQANVERHLTKPGFLLIHGDILDYDKLRQCFSEWRPDIVVHLAARAGVRDSLENPFLYTEVNVNGTLHVLHAAVQSGVKKFVFGSSSSVYGLQEKAPFSEDAPILTPASPYAATKIAGEALCHTYAHLYKMPIVALRFFTVFGPRQRPDLAIHKFARLMLEKKPITVYGDGTSRRDYTYVDDIIQGIRAAINYEPPHGYDVFNLGNSQTVELRELVRILEEKTGLKALIDQKPPQPGDVPQTWADIDKARKFLGFEPKTNLSQGITTFLSWLTNYL